MKTIKNLTADELRKSILQLAIQGKLVKQNPDDEPASELVKRIYEEKNKLIAEGKIKKEKNQSYIFKGDDNCYYEKFGNNEPVKIDDLPFNIPDSWMWIRLKNTSILNSGYAFKSDKFSKNGIRVIRISDFNENGILNKDIKRYPYSIELEQYKILENDILLCMTGGTVGKSVFINSLNEDSYINQRVALIRIFKILSKYFYAYLMSPNTADIINKNKTSTNDNISIKLIEDFLIPLPPLEEQQRIVDKINSFEPLLEKYDKVEKELSKLEKEFPEKLKRSILQYAIEGKLVNQDPDDEPASVLLERIKQEKERLIKEGKIKRDKNESNIYQGDDKNYYENIPSNWEITKYQNVILEIFGGGTPSKNEPKYWNGDIPWCSVKDLGNNLFISNTQESITIEGLNNSSSRIVEAGNIVLCTRMAVGKIRIPTINMAINQDLKGIRLSQYIDKRYFINHVLTNSFKGTGTTVKGINQSDFLDKNFYLPPFNEQVKIVNKIKSINQLIDL